MRTFFSLYYSCCFNLWARNLLAIGDHSVVFFFALRLLDRRHILDCQHPDFWRLTLNRLTPWGELTILLICSTVTTYLSFCTRLFAVLTCNPVCVLHDLCPCLHLSSWWVWFMISSQNKQCYSEVTIEDRKSQAAGWFMTYPDADDPSTRFYW